MRDPVSFSDLFNAWMYGGEQVIKPEKLVPCDTSSVVLPHSKQGKSIKKQRNRDVFKQWLAMTDGRATYCLLGVENQGRIHYAMTIRNALYDIMSLVEQVEEIARERRRQGNKGASPDEFLGGFWKDDKVMPVITLVLYWGADEWDAATDLHDLYSEADPVVMKYAMDYHMNLITPKDMTEENLQSYHSNLRQVFTYIKYSKDKENLKRVTGSDPQYRNLERRDVELINAVTNSNIKIPEGKERIDVCEALEEMMADSRSEGRAEGRLASAANTLSRYMRKNMPITADVLADIAEDNEMSVDKVRSLAREKGISLA